MTAQYNGFCKACRREIKKGEEITKAPAGGYQHVTCPPRKDSYGQTWKMERAGTCAKCCTSYLNNKVRYHYLTDGSRQIEHEDCERAQKWNAEKAEEKAAAKAEREAAAPYQIGGGEGYGCHGWTAGQIVHATKRADGRVVAGACDGDVVYLYVVEAGSTYYREDGMSFGVGDESGHTYWARCREATAEESAELRSTEHAAAARKAANAELDALERAALMRADPVWQAPAGSHDVEGETICARSMDSAIYGGGTWWVIQPDAIWYVQNNGADGDDWSHNNVTTAGAGAIGRRTARTPELEAQLRRLHAAIRTRERV